MESYPVMWGISRMMRDVRGFLDGSIVLKHELAICCVVLYEFDVKTKSTCIPLTVCHGKSTILPGK